MCKSAHVNQLKHLKVFEFPNIQQGLNRNFQIELKLNQDKLKAINIKFI